MTIAAKPQAASLVEEIADLLGPRGFTRDPELVEPWLTDWRGRYTGKALGLASPRSTREVADLVALCTRRGVPIVPQGGNSGMAGGATPDESGESLVLSLRRMDAIREIDAQGGTALVEAGVILQNLHERAEEAQCRFPLTLGGKGSATIGGLIATNAGGTQVLRHGTMRAQVLGLEAVLPDGQVLDRLAVLKKDNRGFDLKQLFIGSEGTLGIVTAARLRLLPAATSRATAWIGLDDPHQARALLQRLQRSDGDRLEGFEIIPAHCLESVLDHVPDARAPLSRPRPWNALVEFVDDKLDDVANRERMENALAEAIESGLEIDAIIASNDAQSDAFWHLRDSISAAERELGPAVQHDISVPVERMPAFIETASERIESAFPGTTCAAFGHLGDGNVHFHVIAPDKAERGIWEEREGKAISARVHDLVTEAGGSISAEHGIGQMKADELERLADPATLSIMHAVKKALDPQGLFNPGKLLAPK